MLTLLGAQPLVLGVVVPHVLHLEHFTSHLHLLHLAVLFLLGLLLLWRILQLQKALLTKRKLEVASFHEVLSLDIVHLVDFLVGRRFLSFALQPCVVKVAFE